MANRVKHMARSHRSYGNNYSVFNGFQYRANVKKGKKELRKGYAETILSKIGNTFNAVKDRFFKKQDR